MKLRIACSAILATAVASSYVTWLVGEITPPLFRSLFCTASLAEALALMPPITRFAADHCWAFTVVNALLCSVAVPCLRRIPDKAPQLAMGTCCGIGLVSWAAMFCYRYEGFTGPMCLHHGPEFDLLNFLSFGRGVFPVTLAVLAASGVTIFFPRSRAKP